MGVLACVLRAGTDRGLPLRNDKSESVMALPSEIQLGSASVTCQRRVPTSPRPIGDEAGIAKPPAN